MNRQMADKEAIYSQLIPYLTFNWFFVFQTRLNELQQLEAKGQTLEPEQQKAVKKLEQVVEMIDLMKDLSKSITEVLTEVCLRFWCT